ncbi:Plexin-A1 [Takifugu flavidus]|uniref:Plexin-A1 n=1 Tax=Takifugu flavidus TaxID=433684 RepID=A0A5C6N462_9TELE|nr:Plexin-A1 [Takifugu flavidus]
MRLTWILWGILVNSSNRPAVIYEKVTVSEEGGPLLRDMLFSPDQQHIYALTDKQNSVRTHSSHLNSECERVFGGKGVRLSLVSTTNDRIRSDRTPDPSAVFPSRAAPIPPAGIKNGREIRLVCPEAAEQVITGRRYRPPHLISRCVVRSGVLRLEEESGVVLLASPAALHMVIYLTRPLV